VSTETNGQFRILYLTHALSSTGAACLASLINYGYDVVGVVTPTLRYKSASLIGSLAALVRRRGLAFTGLAICRTLSAKARVVCRRVVPGTGFVVGFHSIDEVAMCYPMRRLYPADVNSVEFMTEAANLQPNLVVIGISDRILRRDFLARFPGRIINLHPAPLPRFRGPDPLYWQLVTDQPQGAISVHFVTAEIDGGNLLAQEFFPIHRGESEWELKQKVDRIAPGVLITAIERFRKGDNGRPQDRSEVSYQKHRPKGLAACFPRRSSSAAVQRDRRVHEG
jgi:folate-dependent phosphoribosylglycinamide formyltransferase PurN